MKAAVVGSGLIGRSWAIVFARGGHDVALWDQDPEQPQRALAVIDASLAGMRAAGLIDDAEALHGRIAIAGSIPEAVSGAGHVQESIAERVEPKRKLFAEIESYASPDAVLASSTSAIMPSLIFSGLKSRTRCLVAHPMNPPHLAPFVELCGGGCEADFPLGHQARWGARLCIRRSIEPEQSPGPHAKPASTRKGSDGRHRS